MKSKELHKYFEACNETICTDTRNIIKGSLFFALKGANFDGNEFAEKAIQDGAKFAVIDNPRYQKDERFILVKDVLKALQYLAQFHRRLFDIPVIGITGSNGKTTSKELIASVLQKKYNTLVTQGNLNNHLGVPFTLLKLKPTHEIAVVEMGANKLNDIEELCEIAEPNYGVITNVGKAHLEGFGSFENIIQTKCELYDAIEYVDGTVFINTDDKLLMKNAPAVNLVTYGSTGQIKCDLIEVNPFLKFKWSVGDYHSPEIQTHLVGSYNLSNFAAAVAIGYYFDVTEQDICNALSAYVPSNNRSQITKTSKNTLILDCYNANVTSMQAALENFKAINKENKLAILGDMKELGEVSQEEHQNIVNWLDENGIKAILVGAEFAKTKKSQLHFEKVEDAITHLKKVPEIKDELVLLKGSRGIKLELLLEENIF